MTMEKYNRDFHLDKLRLINLEEVAMLANVNITQHAPSLCFSTEMVSRDLENDPQSSCTIEIASLKGSAMRDSQASSFENKNAMCFDSWVCSVIPVN